MAHAHLRTHRCALTLAGFAWNTNAARHGGSSLASTLDATATWQVPCGACSCGSIAVQLRAYGGKQRARTHLPSAVAAALPVLLAARPFGRPDVVQAEADRCFRFLGALCGLRGGLGCARYASARCAVRGQHWPRRLCADRTERLHRVCQTDSKHPLCASDRNTERLTPHVHGLHASTAATPTKYGTAVLTLETLINRHESCQTSADLRATTRALLSGHK